MVIFLFKKFYLIIIIFSLTLTLTSSIYNSNTNSSNTLVYPTTYTNISSYYGYRELYGKQNFHNGVDFLAPQGSKIYSIASGVITYVGFLNGYGNSVIILHNNNTKSLYGHMANNFQVKVGEHVYQSTLIGYVGPKYLENGKLNGNTTGPHLHLSIFNQDGNTIDPFSFQFSKLEKSSN